MKTAPSGQSGKKKMYKALCSVCSPEYSQRVSKYSMLAEPLPPDAQVSLEWLACRSNEEVSSLLNCDVLVSCTRVVILSSSISSGEKCS